MKVAQVKNITFARNVHTCLLQLSKKNICTSYESCTSKKYNLCKKCTYMSAATWSLTLRKGHGNQLRKYGLDKKCQRVYHWLGRGGGGGGVRPESRSRHIVLLHYKHLTRPQGPRYLLPNSTQAPVSKQCSFIFIFYNILSLTHHRVLAVSWRKQVL